MTQVELMTPDQAANLLGVSPRTLAAWRCTGRYSVPYIKVGSKVRYPRKQLNEWLSNRPTGGSQA
ncbi:DNA-binding protein [Pseudomonas sp. FW305-E2]|uniref:helix-turn-helix domain-containing protein n=2 Tax=Pseudomonas sp. FW305-E2 TaxID=2075558 RepID=UPI000B4F64CA|nr:DNA-binding protein [Pseudomonas sp. FW305-E2]